MATEPERRIEQLLRAYAQKRRGEVPQQFELHPVNRRLLHEEIARLRKEAPSTAGWWQVMVQFWRQAALACSILVILGVVLWATNPWQDRTQQFAFKTPDAAMDRKENEEFQKAKGIENKPAERLAKAPDALTEADKITPAPPSRARGNPERLAEEKTMRLSGQKETVAGSEALTKSATAGSAPKQDTGASASTRAGNLAGSIPSTSSQLRSFGMPSPAPSARPSTRTLTGTDQPVSAPVAKPAAPPAVAGAMGRGFGGAGVANEPIKDPVALADEMKLKAQTDASKQLPEKKGEAALSLQPNGAANQLGAVGSFGRSSQSNPAASAAPEVLARRMTPGATTLTADANWAWKDRSMSQPATREQFASLPETANVRPTETPPALLDSFVLERAGNRVRITDADGSVYEGGLLAVSNLDTLAAGKETANGINGVAPEGSVRQKMARSGEARFAAAVNFRAVGTNKTSGQRVEITAIINPPLAAATGADLLSRRLVETNAETTPSAGLAMKSVPSRSAPSVRSGTRGAAPVGGERAPVTQSTPALEESLQPAPPSNAVRIDGTTRIGNRELPLKAVRISK